MFQEDTELPLNREANNAHEQDDEKLLDAIRQKKENAWSLLIERYQGRLTNFAISKLRKREDAEDITQDTFISFIKGLDNYRAEVNLETYLFTILRNKIIDKYRSNSVKSISLIQDVFNTGNPGAQFSAASPSQSWIVSQDEQYQIQQDILAQALLKLCKSFKGPYKFRNLKILEMLLYCGASISTTAELVNVEEPTIRAFKHRSLKQLQNYIEMQIGSKEFPCTNFENLLTSTWESQRLTCPKRSTIGAFLLEQIDPEWFDYIDFHITTLGCHFCRANLKDLKSQKDNQENEFRERIMASTIGFLHNKKD